MTALTRRRSDNEHHEAWHIYSGDVRIGAIGIRTGVPTSADQWGWRLGFYPGMEPGTQRSGSSATFDEGRSAFERAWLEVEPTLNQSAHNVLHLR